MRVASGTCGTDVMRAKHSEHHQFCSTMFVFRVSVVSQWGREPQEGHNVDHSQVSAKAPPSIEMQAGLKMQRHCQTKAVPLNVLPT